MCTALVWRSASAGDLNRRLQSVQGYGFSVSCFLENCQSVKPDVEMVATHANSSKVRNLCGVRGQQWHTWHADIVSPAGGEETWDAATSSGVASGIGSSLAIQRSSGSSRIDSWILVTSDMNVLAKLPELALEKVVADQIEYCVSADHLLIFLGDDTASLGGSTAGTACCGAGTLVPAGFPSCISISTLLAL